MTYRSKVLSADLFCGNRGPARISVLAGYGAGQEADSRLRLDAVKCFGACRCEDMVRALNRRKERR